MGHYALLYLLWNGRVFRRVWKGLYPADAIAWFQRSLNSGRDKETGYCGYPCAQKSSDPPNVILTAIGDDRWSEVDCVVYPWYDRRGARFEDVWILDIDQGLLLWRTPQSFLSLSLAQLCAVSVCTEGMFAPHTAPVIGPLAFAGAQVPTDVHFEAWTPRKAWSDALERTIFRLLSDFVFQWRHVINLEWRVLERMAYAVLRLVALDFSSPTEGPRLQSRDLLVDVHHLPLWERPSALPLSLFGCRVILTPILDEDSSIRAAYEHFISQENQGQQSKYLVFSFHNVILLCIGCGIIRCSQFLPFLKEAHPPQVNLDAVRLLLAAVTPSSSTNDMHLHKLPTEMAFLVMKFMAVDGGVEYDRICCLIERFHLWPEVNMWMNQKTVESLNRLPSQHPQNGIPYYTLLFDNIRIGLAYQDLQD